MKTINDLLDAIKQRRSLETDSALAAALGVKRQTVNNWRQGRNTPDAVACATIAGLSGEPLALVIGIAGEQRAVSAEEKKVWRRLATSAAVIALVIGTTLPGVANATTPVMHATQSMAGEIVSTLCIMRKGEKGGEVVLGAIAPGAGTPLASTQTLAREHGSFHMRMKRSNDHPFESPLRPPCWPAGKTVPNACAAAHHSRVVDGHTDLTADWMGWKQRALATPGGRPVSQSQGQGPKRPGKSGSASASESRRRGPCRLARQHDGWVRASP